MWLYHTPVFTIGCINVFQIYNFVIVGELLAVASIVLAKLHLAYLDSKLQWLSLAKSSSFTWPLRMVVSCFDLGGLRLNFHIGVLIGFTCVAWSGHLVHVALGLAFNPQQYEDSWRQLSSLITFEGGIQSDTCSLYLTDMAHHHLAVGIIFVLSAHLYSSLYKGFGVRLSDLLKLNGTAGSTIIELCKSLHVQLALACAGLGVITSVVAH